MPTLRLQIAKTVFRITCSENLFRAWSFIFDHFQTEITETHATIDLHENRICFQVMDRPAQVLQIESFDQQISILSILILKTLQITQPHLLFLHGNLIRLRDGRYLCLSGRSGLGKTTLTQKIIEFGAGESIAEDNVLISVKDGSMFPYPRAFGCRSTDHQSWKFGTKAWKSHPGLKGNEYVVSELDQSFIPSKVIFVFLCSGIESSDDSETPAVTYTTVLSDEIVSELNKTYSDYREIIRLENCHKLFWKKTPDLEKRKAEEDYFNQQGAMILSSASHDRDFSDMFERPVEPELDELNSQETIHEILDNMIMPGLVHGEDPLRRVFQLLGSISKNCECGFYRLIPGGTPDETIALLRTGSVL